MLDPMGSLITTLRTANIASGRVAGGEAAPGWANGPKEYQRFVVLDRLGTLRFGLAAQQVRIGVRCYAPTFQDAAVLAGEVSDALHLIGGRDASTGWIYESVDEGGGAASTDPVTSQPVEQGVISLICSI